MYSTNNSPLTFSIRVHGMPKKIPEKTTTHVWQVGNVQLNTQSNLSLRNIFAHFLLLLTSPEDTSNVYSIGTTPLICMDHHYCPQIYNSDEVNLFQP